MGRRRIMMISLVEAGAFHRTCVRVRRFRTRRRLRTDITNVRVDTLGRGAWNV